MELNYAILATYVAFVGLFGMLCLATYAVADELA